MREIKFRVWHEPSKLMLKVWKLHHDGFVSVFNREALDNGYCDCSGDPMDTREKRHITQNGGELSSKHPVMQYTGLKDKNGTGKEVYISDIAKDEYGNIFEIVDDYVLLAHLSTIWFEIIGNIYEDSHLLKIV